MVRKSVKAKPKCLVPDCKNPPTRRGLCFSCRIAARREIESGRTTEVELVESGLLLPNVRRGKLIAALEMSRQNK